MSSRNLQFSYMQLRERGTVGLLSLFSRLSIVSMAGSKIKTSIRLRQANLKFGPKQMLHDLLGSILVYIFVLQNGIICTLNRIDLKPE